jgi:hypothetical protein
LAEFVRIAARIPPRANGSDKKKDDSKVVSWIR